MLTNDLIPSQSEIAQKVIIEKKTDNKCGVSINDLNLGETTCDCFVPLEELHTVKVIFKTNSKDPLAYGTKWENVYLEFNKVSWAKDYIVNIKIENEVDPDYNFNISPAVSISSMGSFSKYIDGDGFNSSKSPKYQIKLNLNPHLGNRTIPKSAKITYWIYPMSEINQQVSDVPYYFTSTSGRFYYNYKTGSAIYNNEDDPKAYVDQGICVGNVAKLGTTYRNNDWLDESPCKLTPIIPEVDPDKYNFEWNDNLLLPYSPNNCSFTSYSRTSHATRVNTMYNISRTQKLPQGIVLQDQTYKLPVLASIEDVADVYVRVWQEDEEEYATNCLYQIYVEDKTSIPLIHNGKYNFRDLRSSDNSKRLYMVRDGSDGDGFRFQAQPSITDIFAYDDPKWEGIYNGPDPNQNFNLSDKNGKGVKGRINVDWINKDLNPTSLPNDESFHITAIAQSETGNPYIHEFEVVVKSPDESPPQKQHSVSETFDNVCDIINEVQDEVKENFKENISDIEDFNDLFSGIDWFGIDDIVEGLNYLSDSFLIEFPCTPNHQGFTEKNVEITNSVHVIRNASGMIECELKFITDVNLDFVHLFDLLGISLPITELTDEISVISDMDVTGTLKATIDEQKWANPALSEKIVWANDGAGLFFDNDIVLDYKIFTPLNIIKDKIADKLGDDYISELIKEIIKESDKGANVAIGVEGVLTIDGAIAVINNGGDMDVNIRFFSTKNNGLFERDNSDSEWIPMKDWSRVQPTPKEIFHLEYTHNLK